ncbi:uncharacterized protein EAF01_001957 [Botrytis porri]|nr:uncharacterized protein EAF01_001957 [Botrytis porri]KAF7912936.1 hypothetical protein EAF01_001957 [Botrytis porri]
MDAMARRDQAPKSQDGNVANVKGSNGALAKNGPVAGLSTTASYSEQSSHNINLDGARAVASNKRKCMEPESSSSSNKRTLLVQSHEKTPRPTLVTHHTDPSDNGTQSRYDTPGNHIQTRLGKDQPLDIHDAADKKATKSAKSEAVKARVEDLKAERVAKGKTLAKLARKLHKQRKIAATQQEILENLVNENKRHYGLLNSVHLRRA